MSIWSLNPVRRPVEKPEQADENDDDPVCATEGSDEDEDAEDQPTSTVYEESNLFSVAGVSMPPSFTIPDLNVPEGYRRVGRRWGTYRIYDLHVRVEETKADEAVAAAQRSRENCARVYAAVGQPRIDTLLWDLRDRSRPSRRSGSRPRPAA
jgi:hypothetical protein